MLIFSCFNAGDGCFFLETKNWVVSFDSIGSAAPNAS